MTLLPALIAALSLSAATTETAEHAKQQPVAAPVIGPRYGLGLEFQLGLDRLGSATGGAESRFAPGANVTWEVGRLIGYRALLLEASYLYASREHGTNEVTVASSYHQLGLAPLVGYTLMGWLTPYLKFGPALFLESTSWDVQGTSTSFSGSRLGLHYGGGLRALFDVDAYAISARLELAGTARGPYADTLFSAGAGIVF